MGITTIDKTIRSAEYLIYTVLIIMGIFTLIQPDWLISISTSGRNVEAATYKEQGNLLLRKGNFRSAIIIYKKALSIKSDYESVIGNMGIAYTQLKEYSIAIQYYKKLLQMENVDYGKTYFNIAELFSKQNDNENAINNYLNALNFIPDPTDTYRKLGYHYIISKEYDKAINAFENALKLSTDINTYYQATQIKYVSDSLSVSQKSDKIQKIRKAVLEEGELMKYDVYSFENDTYSIKENAKTYNYLGITNQELGNQMIAKSHFRKALQLWPSFSEAKKNLKKLFEQNEQY